MLKSWNVYFIIVMLPGEFILYRFDCGLTVPKKGSSSGDATEVENVRPLDMIKTNVFYLFYLWLFFYAACGQAFISNISPIASILEASVMTAAVIVGLSSVFNGIGRVVIGGLLDKIDTSKMMVYLSIYLFLCLMIITISLRKNNLAMFTAGAVMMGISFAGIPTSISVFVVET